ncbi:MAG: helix-turn-helix domain-containing protein [Parasporobacterium sp.]|nr:helix-turn-helix domain-containing protein [Parasporobacterium sp.]
MKKNTAHFRNAECILFLTEDSEDTENTVYVAPDSCDIPAFSNALVVFSGKRRTKCSSYIHLLSGSAAEILNVLLKAKAHLDRLNNILSGGSENREIIDRAYEYLGFPMFYFDASYRILAMSTSVDFPDDSEWVHMKQNGFLSGESARLMAENGDLDLLADKKDPFHYNASFFPFESLVCNIWLEGRFYGRLNVLFTDRSPDEMNLQECRIICSHLERIAAGDRDRLSFTGPVSSMIADLLKGIPISEELILDRLSRMPGILNSTCQVCCIDPDVRNDPQVLMYYTSSIDSLFAGHRAVTLEFENKIIVIMHGYDHESFENYHAELDVFLKKQNLRGCVSNYFTRFSSLREHYLQAESLLETTETAGLMHFTDLFFSYAVSFIPRNRALAMISHDILRLKELQKDYQFPLAGTLRTYLECGCNLQLTAQKLFVHKNTALYRINHIKELLGTDLDDGRVREQLMFSFHIMDAFPDQL